MKFIDGTSEVFKGLLELARDAFVRIKTDSSPKEHSDLTSSLIDYLNFHSNEASVKAIIDNSLISELEDTELNLSDISSCVARVARFGPPENIEEIVKSGVIEKLSDLGIGSRGIVNTLENLAVPANTPKTIRDYSANITAAISSLDESKRDNCAIDWAFRGIPESRMTSEPVAAAATQAAGVQAGQVPSK